MVTPSPYETIELLEFLNSEITNAMKCNPKKRTKKRKILNLDGWMDGYFHKFYKWLNGWMTPDLSGAHASDHRHQLL